jgi:ketosteroid isomerase-like protein
MAQENVELVEEAFEAFIRGDVEACLERCAEDVVTIQPPELPGVSPRQHGHSGVLEAFAIWPEQWDDYRIEDARVVAHAEDFVVVSARTRGRGRQSGVEVEMDFSFVFTVRERKIAQWQIFVDEAQALEAAGLSGDGA